MAQKKRYTNIDCANTSSTLTELFQWQKERRAKNKDLEHTIAQAPYKDIKKIKQNRSTTSITWIGHSTFLIQMNGLNIITDPVWAERMGFGKRLTAPGLEIDDLPEIHAVLISHSHYDHLNFKSIKQLKGNPTYYVPAGLARTFTTRGLMKVLEFNWYDSIQHSGMTFTFVPAQHWTKRTLTDTNTSHWGGWVIENEDSSIYFAGDTADFPGFSDLAERFDIDTVLMPIGAYEPEWFMKATHINPEDAVKAFLELKGKTFIPMHYGTYHLADDTGPEAIARLDAEWKRLGLDESRLKKLLIGETWWI
ncbi:MBL fold metallo-hydrolase [Sporosarcina sp. Sa2YVA2]|uniref:MBL fold metallo-hydrolase n=1 Tax=Sporosarcina quadrami TaxID=2762234 RepID=A0ABR8UB14_9BACL|nr:MBL fold metallo-hydrolase [Sporosarcina quadrami]MBD7984934.1 MBL fold metallo-hydrolase [Sporosarcina quadrami]